MKTKKSTLITIIVLLVIFLPPALYGTISKLNSFKEKENVNKEFFFNGSLYFYDNVGNEKGRYKCVSDDCGHVKTIIDDEEYGINYYQFGEKEELAFASDDYALIEDNGEIFVYSLKLNQKIVTFQAVKDYHTDLANNLLIVQNETGKWGVLALDNMTTLISYGYDYIGLVKKIEDQKLKTDSFIVKEDDNWFILNSDNTRKSDNTKSPIINYNDNYLLTKDNELYNYSGTLINIPISYQNIYLVDDYVVLLNNDILLVYRDLNENSIGLGTISNYETIDFEINDKTLNVYLDGTIGTSIDLNI